MKLKLTFASATALGLLMGGAAWAADNANYLTQSGDYNDASVNQTVGGGNQLGTSLESASQSGDHNDLDVIQSNGSSLGVPGTYSLGVDQNSDRNKLSVTQENGTVQQVQQTGVDGASATTNELSIIQDDNFGNVAGFTNKVGSVSQTYTGTAGGSDRNKVSISQNMISGVVTSNHLNSIGSVSQDGVAQSLTVSQDGGWNTLTTSTQVGADNIASVVQGSALGGSHNYTKLLEQDGTGNLGVLSLTGIGNGAETGGIARSVTGNHTAVLIQDGDFNDAGLDITGDSNGYGIRQDGTGNIASGLSISGNSNQLGIGQYGDYNLVTLADIGGDSNMVGLLQDGNSNEITGTAFGDSGTVDVEQHGDDNVTAFSQTGADNYFENVTTGDRNKLNVTQAAGASGNTMTVLVTGDDNNNYPVSPGFSDDALEARDYARADLGSNLFVQGDLFQSGSGNSLLVTVSASDKNAFATYQNGDGNSISHSITGGESNQAVIAQVGGGNTSTTAQTGSFNNLGVSQ